MGHGWSVESSKWELHLQNIYEFMLRIMKSPSEHEYKNTRNKNHWFLLKYLTTQDNNLKNPEWLITFKHKQGGKVVLSLTLKKDCVKMYLADLYYDYPKLKTATKKYMSVSEVVANGLGLCYVFAKRQSKNRIIFCVKDKSYVVPQIFYGLKWMQVLHVIRSDDKSIPRSIYDVNIELPGWHRQTPIFDVHGGTLSEFDTSDPDIVRDAKLLYNNRQTKTLDLSTITKLAANVRNAWKLQTNLPQSVSQTVTIEYVLRNPHTKLDDTSFRTRNGIKYQRAWLRLRL